MTQLIAAAITDRGLERDSNEDRAFAQVATASDGEPGGLFVLCDGMGGHLGGECASHWAVEAVKQQLASFFTPPNPRATVALSAKDPEAALSGEDVTQRSPGGELEELVEAAVQKANQVVYEYARRHPQAEGAGTTLVLALIQGRQAVIANVGDSRVYLLRDHQLRQITQDHSLVATLVAAGQVRPEDVFTHPQRNVIYRSLGQKDELVVDIFVEKLQEGDGLLLCSDGLWEMVRDERTMAQLIDKAADARRACKSLVQAAMAAGGEDNIGVIVVKVAGT